MREIIELIPDDIPEWALEAIKKGQLWCSVFDEIKKLQKEINEIQRDRAKCIEILDAYYSMNLIGNKQEFTNAHNRARRYLESKRVEKCSLDRK